MSEGIPVAGGEAGLVRVFASPAGLDALRAAKEAGDARAGAVLAEALGAPALDPAFVDVLRAGDLAPLTLTDYLIEGIGVEAAAVERDRARLDALPGAVVVLSRAVAGRAERLVPAPGLALVGTYPEDRPPASAPPLASDGARGTLGTPAVPPAPAGPGGLPRGFVLVALALVAAAVALFLLPWR